MLRLLLRVIAVCLSGCSALVILVRLVSPLLPTAGVLELVTDTTLLLDLTQGMRLALPYDAGVVRFSPDHTCYMLAHADQSAAANTYYYVYGVDGKTRTFLYGGPTETVLTLPEWSPDGTRLAFVRRPSLTENAQAYVINADGSGQRALTDSTWVVQAVTWWPDNRRLLLTLYAPANLTTDLATVDLVTGQFTHLTHDAARESSPQILPDGSTIFYLQAGVNGTQLMQIQADGSAGQPLPLAASNLYSLALSPDGQWLAYLRIAAAEPFQLYRYHLQTQQSEPIALAAEVYRVGWWR